MVLDQREKCGSRTCYIWECDVEIHQLFGIGVHKGMASRWMGFRFSRSVGRQLWFHRLWTWTGLWCRFIWRIPFPAKSLSRWRGTLRDFWGSRFWFRNRRPFWFILYRARTNDARCWATRAHREFWRKTKVQPDRHWIIQLRLRFGIKTLHRIFEIFSRFIPPHTRERKSIIPVVKIAPQLQVLMICFQGPRPWFGKNWIDFKSVSDKLIP